MAKASIQYALDMRTIAAVTLLFLPGTYVATLFSSSFWAFQPSNQGPSVSKWVWIYWVTAAVLTLTVMSAWKFVSKKSKDPQLDDVSKSELQELQNIGTDDRDVRV